MPDLNTDNGDPYGGAPPPPYGGPKGIVVPLQGNPKGQPKPKTSSAGAPDPFADLATDYVPPTAAGAGAAAGGDPWAALSTDYEPAAPQRQVGTGEALVRGGIDAATFGLEPTLTGLSQAGTAGMTQEQKDAVTPPGVASEAPGMEAIGEGLARAFGSHPDQAARDAFERGRQESLNNKQLAQEQDPWAFFGGQIAGSALTPAFGMAAPGNLSARIVRGMIGGGIGAGGYSAGTATSEGKTAPEIAQAGAVGSLEGVGFGGLTAGLLGPRAAKIPTTPGERAAATAESLGAPLPRGVASDSPMVQGTTAKLQSVPFAGENITKRVKATQNAAGEAVGDVANTMTGGINDRAASDVIVRPGMQAVIDDNKASIDKAYDGVRSSIDRNAAFTMPRTAATLDAIAAARKAAGKSNPEEGLDQFRNVSRGATFEGAHRARTDARAAGNPLVPHPGYNAADYNRLTGAMTADIRNMVGAAAQRKGNNPQQALAAFDKAEKEFGPLKEQNEMLERLVNAKGEGSIAKLLGSAKEKGGDVRLLAQLRNKMPGPEFQQIGGMLLNELGANESRAGGSEFSLSKFVTNWNKLSDRGKAVLFDPAHLRNIEDIVGMGEHIKGALEKTNTSKTGDMLVLYELVQTGVESAIAIGAGVMSPMAGMTAAAGFAGANLFTRYLASPKNAASMAAWTRAYRAFATQPTPARIGVLTVATRNMANTLGLDPAKTAGALQSHIQGMITGRSEDQGADQNQ
jgi:hypothetical protein